MRRNRRGYSLVELMTIVAVVGVLAAIAIPAYQNYAVRSKLSEALAMMGACKTSVTDYLVANRALPANLGASGCENYAGTQYVASIDVVDGVITVTMVTTTKLGPASGGSLKLEPTVDANNFISVWACHPDTVPPRLLPGECRS